jgi:two-component system, NtrC family, sensor histidine kinase HydH
MIYRVLRALGRIARGPREEDAMLSQGAPFRSHARHGILATALLLGLVLVLTTWTAWRDAEALAETLCEGQSEFFLRGLRAQTRRRRVTYADLLTILDQYADRGLRGSGLLQEDGTIRKIVGTISEPQYPTESRPRGRHLRRVGDRYQLIAPPPDDDGPPRPGPEMPPPPGPPPGEPLGASLFPEGTRPVWVFEFEPVLSAGLTQRARNTFVLATGAAVLLAFAAIVLWRRAGREEALAAKLAQSERLVSLGTMSAVLAHEIKNPLAALKGNAQLVAESLTTTDTRARGQADRVVEAAVRLQGLVENLLDFARGGLIDRVETDPAELLFLAAEDAAPTAALELDEAPATWSLDVIRVRQVLENLLRNAVAASKNGLVTASVTLEGERLVYTVRDDGPGFPEGTTETSFEPFVTTKSRGVGLGLSVARRIVTMHGGEITANNRPEGGAELRVSIPRA